MACGKRIDLPGLPHVAIEAKHLSQHQEELWEGRENADELPRAGEMLIKVVGIDSCCFEVLQQNDRQRDDGTFLYLSHCKLVTVTTHDLHLVYFPTLLPAVPLQKPLLDDLWKVGISLWFP